MKGGKLGDFLSHFVFLSEICSQKYIFPLIFRQAKIARADFTPYDNPSYDSSTSVVFNPNVSDSDIPLKPSAGASSPYQQWDKNGRAVGYAGDPHLYAPHPQRRDKGFMGRYEEEGAHRQSVESVGWDMQPSSSRETIPPRFASPPGVGSPRTHDPFDSVETVHQIGYAPRRSSPVVTTAHTTTRATTSPPPRTPTQAQYAQYVPGRLPSPYDGPPGTEQDAYYRHGAEATDATYATAHSTFESDLDSDPPPQSPLLPPPSRTTALTPPESKYRTSPGALR
jgi:hypothetical protein